MVWNARLIPRVFPVATVNRAIDVKQPRESFVDDLDREIYELCMSQFVPPVMSC